MWKFTLCFFLFSFILNAQELSNGKEVNQIKGVEITYLSNENDLAKLGLKVGDIILSFAHFPTPQEKYLTGIDQFIRQLESNWVKEGKSKEFWKKNSESIKQKTRGTFIQPVAFSKEEKPLYEVALKRKNQTNSWILKKFKLPSGSFLSLFQEKKLISQKSMSWYRKGNQALKRKNYEEALLFYQKSLQLNRKLNDIRGIAASLSHMGEVYEKQGNLVEALKHYKPPLNLYKQMREFSGFTKSLTNIGRIYEKQKQPEKALAYYHQALKLYQQAKDLINVSLLLNQIGGIYLGQERLEEALDCFQQSLKLYQQLNDLAGTANLLNNIGGIYHTQEQSEKAIHYFQQALELYKQIGNTLGIATALNSIVQIYQYQGNIEKALEYAQQSLKLYKEIGEVKHISRLLNEIGSLYQKQGDLEKALDYTQQTLKLDKQVGDPKSFATHLNSLGNIYKRQGKIEKALESYEASLAIFKQDESVTEVALLYSQIGMIYHLKGELARSLQYHLLSLKWSKQKAKRSNIANAQKHIGIIYEEQGKTEKALASYEAALAIYQQLKRPNGIADLQSAIAGIYAQKGKLGKALKYYQSSLVLFEKTGNSAGKSSILNNIGSVYNSQNNFEEALEYYDAALILAKKVGNPENIAKLQQNIGTIYEKQGAIKLALEFYLSSLKLYKPLGSPQNIANALHAIALVYQKQGKLELAIENRLKAIEQIRFIANKAGSGRDDYFKKNLYRFAQTIELSNATHPKEAFETLQYCKAFGFTTTLSELSLSLEKNIDPNLLQQKKSLLAESALLYKQIEESKSKNTTQKEVLFQKKQLKHIEKELEEVLENIRSGNPAYAQIDYPKPATIEDIQNILQEDEVFLDYFCASNEYGFPGKTYCFVIGKNLFEVIPLIETEKINKKVTQFRSLLWESQEEEFLGEYEECASNLFKILIQPILNKFEEKQIKHLIIAPDGLLNLLAFDALTLDREQKAVESYEELNYLLDQYTISYTMSATIYKYIHDFYSKANKEKNSSISIFGLGDPSFGTLKKNDPNASRYYSGSLSPLPGTREELESISTLFEEQRKKILFAKKATEPNLFLEDLLPYQVLHFATHGLIDTEKPFYSSLALTPLTEKQQKTFKEALEKKGFEAASSSDGFLRVRDIFTLHKKIKAQLVVLSACDTATGKMIRGDGIVGLTRAFQFAGTPSIIVSLWSVNDESTNHLMQAFYQEILKGNPTSLEGRRSFSLHNAKKKLRHSKRYPAPYYWAPFILRGLK